MYEKRNYTPFIAELVVNPDKDGIDKAVALIKATFALNNETIRIADLQEPVVWADQYYGAPGKSSVKYASEISMPKPATDIVLIGHAYARGKSRVSVSLKVGRYHKTVYVFGDRYWKGLFGYGWTTPLDAEASLCNRQIHYRDPRGKDTLYPLVETGKTKFCGVKKIKISRDEKSIFLTDKNHITRRFDIDNPEGTGRLAEISDLNSNTIKFIYEGQYLKKIIDANARAFNLRYNNRQMVASISSFFESENREINLRTYRYDDKDCLVKVFDELKNPFLYHYDAENRMTQKTNRNGYSYYYQYQDDGRCIRGWGEDGMVTVELNHYPKKRKTEVFDASGNKTTYHYYPNKLFSMVIDPLGNNTQYYYDKNHNLSGIIKKDKNTIVFSYDAYGNLTKIRDEEGHIREFSQGDGYYQSTDPLGNTTYDEYDPCRNLIRRTYANGSSEELKHNPRGEIVEIKTVTGAVIKIHREGSNTIIVERPTENKTTYILNDWGKVILERDAFGHEIHSTYDMKSRLISRTNKNGHTTKYRYDAEDNLSWVCDPLENEKYYEYDGFNHLIKTMDAHGHTIHINFNNNGNVAEIINENNESHTYRYDALNRLILENGFDGDTTYYDFDAEDNIAKIKKPDGTLIEASYDKKGRLSGLSATRANKEHDWINYTYDAANNLVKAENKEGALSFKYNEMNQLIEEIHDGGSTQWSYEHSSVLSTRKTPWSDATEFKYDQAGFVNEIRLSKDKFCSFKRDALGRPVESALSNGVTLENSYDAIGLLQSQKYHGQESILIERHYRYAPNDRLIKAGDHIDYREFEYDRNGQLTQVQHLLNKRVEDFRYDPAGNLLLLDRSIKVDCAKGNRIEKFKGIEYRHDYNGNIIERKDEGGVTLFQYDSFDQLINVTLSDGRNFEYRYDALGRRTKKIDLSQGKTTQFFWEKFALLAEKTENEFTEYLYYPETFNPIAMIRNNKLYFFSVNNIGTPCEVLDDIGNIAWSAQYDAFGRCRIDNASLIKNNLRFPGQYYDSETGLHYNMFRYYDPLIGRYLSKDPIGFRSGELNLYRYSLNNPINFIDPKGTNFSCEEKNEFKKCMKKCESDNAELKKNIEIGRNKPTAKEVPSVLCSNVDNTTLKNFCMTSVKNIQDWYYDVIDKMADTKYYTCVALCVAALESSDLDHDIPGSS